MNGCTGDGGSMRVDRINKSRLIAVTENRKAPTYQFVGDGALAYGAQTRGFERVYGRTDETIADWLTGNVAVVCCSTFNFGSAGEPMPTMLR